MQGMRTRARTISAVLAMAAILGACATPAPATQPPTQAPTPTPPPTASPTPVASGDLTGDLLVLEWSGYEEEDYWLDFKEKYPRVEVTFQEGLSDADIYGKIKAGSQVDTFHAYTGWLQFYVDEGLVEEIDTSRLANWDKVPDSFKAVGEFDGKYYFVPFDWGFTSILYRTDMVEDEVTSWSALFDERYSGHISMWDDGPGAVTVSSYIHGWDETAITDEQLAQAKQEWIEQKPLNTAYWVYEYSDLVPMFESGDVWLAYSWQGAYATLLAGEMPVAYADPVEGRNSWVGVYGITKGSPNYDLALRFLDEKLGELAGANTVNNFYYGHANADVMAAVTDETLIEAFSLNDPTVLQRTNFTPNLTAEQRDAWTQMWAEVKASQ